MKFQQSSTESSANTEAMTDSQTDHQNIKHPFNYVCKWGSQHCVQKSHTDSYLIRTLTLFQWLYTISLRITWIGPLQQAPPPRLLGFYTGNPIGPPNANQLWSSVRSLLYQLDGRVTWRRPGCFREPRLTGHAGSF